MWPRGPDATVSKVGLVHGRHIDGDLAGEEAQLLVAEWTWWAGGGALGSAGYAHPSIEVDLDCGEQTVRNAAVTPEGDQIRWVELPGQEPSRVYVHGLGASSPAYFTEVAVHPLLAGRRSLLVDMLGHGISDRPTGFDYTLQSHADALATALTRAGVSGAEVIAHSMGGSVAIVLAHRHPHLVSRLVLVDANLDPIPPAPGAMGSRGIAAHSEQRFLAGGWEEVRDQAGPHWWSTMRLTGREALHRSAVHLTRGTVPTMRELLLDLEIPRTYLLPEADGPLPGAGGLTEAGVTLVAIADCGHNIMLDNPEAFVRATATALSDRDEG